MSAPGDIQFAGVELISIDIAEETPELDQLEILTDLLAKMDRIVRRRFLELVDASKTIRTLDAIAGLLENGQIFEALTITEQIAPSLEVAIEQAFAASGQSIADLLSQERDIIIDFNTLSDRAVTIQQAARARLIREFTAQQREATMELLNDAVLRGLAPTKQAEILADSIGLTGRQARAVTNYRRLLEAGSTEALTRELRDKRFDRTVRRAIASGVPLSPGQIYRMDKQYTKRYVRFRAETIARTETARAISEGEEEMWRQAIDAGVVTPDEIISIWHTAGDERVRSSHSRMNRQSQPFGAPFRSGLGNELRFPGDPQAPAADVINCRCVIARELKSRRNPEQAAA